MRKYEKTLANHGGFKQCFNDVLGFRLRFDKYPNDFPDYFRVVDLRNGKQVDMVIVRFTFIIREIV